MPLFVPPPTQALCYIKSLVSARALGLHHRPFSSATVEFSSPHELFPGTVGQKRRDANVLRAMKRLIKQNADKIPTEETDGTKLDGTAPLEARCTRCGLCGMAGDWVVGVGGGGVRIQSVHKGVSWVGVGDQNYYCQCCCLHYCQLQCQYYCQTAACRALLPIT